MPPSIRITPSSIRPAEEVTARNFQTVRDYVEQAGTHRDGRVPTNPGNDRKVVRRIAGPLRVGKATEDHFLFGEDTFAYWGGELDRAAQAISPLTVGALQQHIDALTPAWGLRPEARDLVIAAWVLLRKRAWFEAGAAIVAPALGRLRPSIELRAEALPNQQAWDAARTSASKLFGYTTARTYLTGANVAEFATAIRAKATDAVTDLTHLCDELDKAHLRLGLPGGDDDRLIVAQALRDFADTLSKTAGNVAVIDAMAAVTLPVALETAARIRGDAAQDSRTLRTFKWKLAEALIPAAEVPGESGDQARAITKRLRDAVAIPGRVLSDELSSAENSLTAWVVEDKPVPAGSSVLSTAADVASLTSALADAVTKEHKTIRVQWWVQ